VLSGPLTISNLSNPLMTQLSLCKLLCTFGKPDCRGDGLANIQRSFWVVEYNGISEDTDCVKIQIA